MIFFVSHLPSRKEWTSQNCNKWNSTSWWTRRQKLFIVNELLESKCTNYVNTDIYCLSPDGDWIRENGYLDISLFYKDKLHLIEKGYLKLALCIKRKISLFQKKLLIQTTSRKDKNHFLTLTISRLHHPNQTQTQTNKITRGPWMHHLGIITPTQLLLPLKHIYYNHNQIQKKSYPQNG